MSSVTLAFRTASETRRPHLESAGELAIAAVDALAALGAGAAAVLVRYAFGSPYDLGFYLRLAPLALLYPAALAMAGMYPTVALNPVVELRGIWRSTTVLFLFFAAATFFQRDAYYYSRSALLLAWFFTLIAAPLARVAARALLCRTGGWGAKAIIIGAGPAGRRLAQALHANPSLGLRVVGLLDEGSAPAAPCSWLPPAVGGLEMAPALAHETGARYAILAMPGVPARRLAAIVERHLWNFHHVLIVPDLAGISSLEVVTRDLGGTIGVAVSHRLLFRAPRLFKRVFDLTFATLGGVVLLPLFGLLWALVRITSPGPGFYASPRIGERGQPFRAWKFRTMRMGGNDVLRPEHLSELARERKLRLDPRVTRIGKWLRRMSLDELPQLWNVIRGEMSLVGPRPILEDEAERYGSRYLLYKRVRPGLTGMWQVSGRNNTTYEQRLKCVEYYVRNWSVWLDLYILGKTVKVVLTGEGAF